MHFDDSRLIPGEMYGLSRESAAAFPLAGAAHMVEAKVELPSTRRLALTQRSASSPGLAPAAAAGAAAAASLAAASSWPSLHSLLHAQAAGPSLVSILPLSSLPSVEGAKEGAPGQTGPPPTTRDASDEVKDDGGRVGQPRTHVSAWLLEMKTRDWAGPTMGGGAGESAAAQPWGGQAGRAGAGGGVAGVPFDELAKMAEGPPVLLAQWTLSGLSEAQVMIQMDVAPDPSRQVGP